MKIIDAFWEKRNLGCDVAEIICSYEDERLEEERIKALFHPYQVMKIPCSRGDMLFQAQELGFRVIECQVSFKTKTRKIILPEKYQRFYKEVSYHVASDEETKEVIRRIRDDRIFTTDRIALDPYFSTEIAGRRYANWIQDLMKNGYVIYIKCYREKVFGWVITSVLDGRIADMILGGNFQGKVWSGMGVIGHYLTIQIARDMGAESIKEAVSTNNLRSIKLLLEFGSNIEQIQYVLVKHLSKMK